MMPRMQPWGTQPWIHGETPGTHWLSDEHVADELFFEMTFVWRRGNLLVFLFHIPLKFLGTLFNVFQHIISPGLHFAILKQVFGNI